MTQEGTRLPSASKVRDQVEAYERSGAREANTFTGLPVIIVAIRGNRSGSIHKKALMRVEHDGEYALVASWAGAAPSPFTHRMPSAARTERQMPGERCVIPPASGSTTLLAGGP